MTLLAAAAAVAWAVEADPGGDRLVAVVVVTTVVAAALGMVLVVRAQRRRHAAAAAWAQARAWDHDPDGGELHRRYTGPPFDLGHARASERVLRGRHAGRDVVCFDYRYDLTTGSGVRGDRHERTTRWAVVAVRRPPGSSADETRLDHPGVRALLEQRPGHEWRLDGGDLLLLREGELDLATLDEDVALCGAVLDALGARG